MPCGEGWWLHPRKGTFPIFEHLVAVRADPRRFGVDTERHPGEADAAYRARILTAAMRRGWVRVRAHRGEVSIECWRLTPATARLVRRFVDEDLAAGPGMRVNVNEIGRSKQAP